MPGDEVRQTGDQTQGAFAPPPHRDQTWDETCVPKDLKVRLQEQRLTVLWKDGVTSEFDLLWLRKNCPCASCRSTRSAEGSATQSRDASAGKPRKPAFTVLKSDPTTARAVTASLVGTYAIRFTFSDGHDTGIYDFKYLRALASRK